MVQPADTAIVKAYAVESRGTDRQGDLLYQAPRWDNRARRPLDGLSGKGLDVRQGQSH